MFESCIELSDTWCQSDSCLDDDRIILRYCCLTTNPRYHNVAGLNTGAPFAVGKKNWQVLPVPIHEVLSVWQSLFASISGLMYMHTENNKMLSYRRETMLQGAL